MKLVSSISLLLIVTTSANGFFMKKKVYQVATAEIDEECVRLANTGDCGFYACFNLRHQCPHYLIEHEHDLCKKMFVRRPQFTPEGQGWLVNNTKCVMKNLIPFYRTTELNCDELTDAGYGFIQSCSLAGRPNVCDIVWPNMEHFMAVTNMRSMRDARFAFSTMTKCGLQSFRRFLEYVARRGFMIPLK